MSVLAEIEVSFELARTVTAQDFAVAEHEHDFRVRPGVCATCGKIRLPEPAGIVSFGDPFPKFGSDEYLTW